MLLFQLFIIKAFGVTNLTVGIDITSPESLNFLARLDQHYEQFAEKGLEFEIQNHILPCYTCEKRHQFKQAEPNCYAGGKYCQYSTYTSGQLLLTEIIRQRCLFNHDKSIYLNYINFFEKNCIDNPHYAYCSQNILQKYMNYSEFNIEKCINDSFENVENQQLSENYILKYEKLKQFNQSKLTIYLDDENVSQFTFHQIIEQICLKMRNNPPEYCNINTSLEKNTTIKLDDQIFFWLFIVLILLLILLSIGILNKTKSLLKKSTSIPQEETIRIIQEENVQ